METIGWSLALIVAVLFFNLFTSSAKFTANESRRRNRNGLRA